MKNFDLRLILIVIGIAFISGCSDDPEPYVADPIFVPNTDITSQLHSYLTDGKRISLDEGTFYVSESIIVEGFCGIVEGHPNGKTRIEVSSGFKAAVDPSLNLEPGEKLTEIFAIYNASCDVTFQNLVFDIVEAAPAEEHENPWLGTVTTIDNCVVVAAAIGAEINLTYRNLHINGNQSNDAGAVNGRNLAWPLIGVGPESGNTKIHYRVDNCVVNNSGQVAIEFWRTIGGDGEIANNTIINSYSGVWIGPVTTATTVNITDNVFTTIDNACIVNDGPAKLCSRRNTLNGIAMDDNCPQ